jgi:hypothetical protein
MILPWLTRAPNTHWDPSGADDPTFWPAVRLSGVSLEEARPAAEPWAELAVNAESGPDAVFGSLLTDWRPACSARSGSSETDPSWPPSALTFEESRTDLLSPALARAAGVMVPSRLDAG